MGLSNIIRRMALREKQSIREISRRTGLSCNAIAKYLSAGMIEPTFTVSERPSKLDPFADKLAAWLLQSVVPIRPDYTCQAWTMATRRRQASTRLGS